MDTNGLMAAQDNRGMSKPSRHYDDRIMNNKTSGL